MPTARGNEGRLREAIVFFLVRGTLPPIGGPGRDGMLQAFELRHTRLGRAEYLDELRGIWLRHRAQILEAAGGAEPWVATVLSDPSRLDENENDETGDDEEGER